MKKPEATKRWSEVSFAAGAKSILEKALISKMATIKIDLRGIKIGLDGVPGGLEAVDFQDVLLKDADASYAQFSCAFSRANFQSSIFAQVIFDTCRFRDAKFLLCDFSDARLNNPTLDDSVFTSCNFLRSRISGRGGNEYGGRRTAFRDCVFTEVIFQNIQLRAAVFENCTFIRSVFKKCYLVGVKVIGNSIGREVFEGCHIELVTVNGEQLKADG